jgi:predicted alpha/beta hydrolase family esterase
LASYSRRTPTKNSIMKVIILPGNGCTDVLDSNWYGWLKSSLEDAGVTCIAENMPDPYQARRKIWIPFIRDTLRADDQTILVGHSSGAQAAMRYAEEYKVAAVVLVAATYTDLGDAGERQSGYYPLNNETENLYDFAAMRANCPTWRQFHSDDDCFIPLAEALRVRDGLQLTPDEFALLPGRSHFFYAPFNELLAAVVSVAQGASK